MTIINTIASARAYSNTLWIAINWFSNEGVRKYISKKSVPMVTFAILSFKFSYAIGCIGCYTKIAISIKFQIGWTHTLKTTNQFAEIKIIRLILMRSCRVFFWITRILLQDFQSSKFIYKCSTFLLTLKRDGKRKFGFILKSNSQRKECDYFTWTFN